jgi:hypothetical protein
MKKLSLLFLALFSININISAQQFTEITDSPVVNDGSNFYNTGVAWGDYDKDGDCDLILTTYDPIHQFEENVLFQNNCNGRFTKVAVPGIATDRASSRSSAWIDYNNDGNLDLFVCNGANETFLQRQGSFLYRNNADGTFTRITSGPGAHRGRLSMGHQWADINNDSYIDVAVADIGGPVSLYMNNGDDTFAKVTDDPVVTDGALANDTAVAFADIDNDGDQDLFVLTLYETPGNRFYRNNGEGGFTRVTDSVVGDDPNNLGTSTSASFVDYNDDGDLDLYVCNLSFRDGGITRNFLYRNDDGTFTEVTTAGPIVTDTGKSAHAAWSDYDNDGDIDVYVTRQGSNKLYDNNGDGTFTSNISSIIVDAPGSGGAAWADFNNDGYPDLIVPSGEGQDNSVTTKMYVNNGNGNNWVNIKLIGTQSNTNAIGARVSALATINGSPKRQYRVVSSTNGGLNGGQNMLNVHFGLRHAPIIDELTIDWPASGIVQVFNNVPVNTFMEITEEESSDPINIQLAALCEPDLSTIRGTVYHNIDNDCVVDEPEETTVPNQMVKVEDSDGFGRYVFSDAAGGYVAKLPPGNYNVSLVEPAGFPFFCNIGINVPLAEEEDSDGNDLQADALCDPVITLTGEATDDFCGGVFAYTPCAGFGWGWRISIDNSTGELTNGKLKFTHNGWIVRAAIDPIRTTCPVDSIDFTGTPLEFVANLGTIEANDNCSVYFNVLYEDPANNLLATASGTYTAQLTADCGGVFDIEFDPDTETITQECACDPNDKMVSPAGCGPLGLIGRDEKLTYLVRFQNEGTGAAHKVVIKDVIDGNLDIESLRILASSHDITGVEVLPGNELVITFEGIELPPLVIDPLGSVGYVKFSLDQKPGLADGTPIKNNAAIIFDRNLPVITNTVLNTVVKDNPLPIASFEAKHATNTGLVYNFTYTGGTSDGATFEWDFGPDATPSYSTVENPTGIEFESPGLKNVTLTLSRFGCTASIIETINVVRLFIVAIDIKPGSDPNSINLGSGGTVPVALFSTPAFNAPTMVDPTTVTLAGAPVRLKGNGTPMAGVEDIDGDGIFDLVVHVVTEALELSGADVEAILEGQMFEGTLIRGSDSVRVVPRRR